MNATVQTDLHDINVVHVSSTPNPGYTRFDVSRRGTLGLGNPYAMKSEADRDYVIDRFRQTLWFNWIHGAFMTPEHDNLIQILYAARRGPVELACYCAPKSCHADIIKNCIVWMNTQELYSE